jgi:hypothetical protein
MGRRDCGLWIVDWGLGEEEEEEDAGRDAPQTAWGKMPQPQRPADGLGQDAPATTPRGRPGATCPSHFAGCASHDACAPWHAAALGRDGRQVPRATGLGAMDGGRFADWPPMSRANLGRTELRAEFAKGWDFLPGLQRHAAGKAEEVKAETLKS